MADLTNRQMAEGAMTKLDGELPIELAQAFAAMGQAYATLALADEVKALRETLEASQGNAVQGKRRWLIHTVTV